MSDAELKEKYSDETLEQLSDWLEKQGQAWLQKHHVEDYRNHKKKAAQAEAMERLFYKIKHRLDAAIKRREAERNKPEEKPGNAAALREALEYVLQFDATDEAAEEDGLTDAERIAEYADHIEECQKKARAALAAPARNCDRFKTELEAFAFYLKHTPDNGNLMDGYPEWLFATELICGDAARKTAEGGAE